MSRKTRLFQRFFDMTSPNSVLQLILYFYCFLRHYLPFMKRLYFHFYNIAQYYAIIKPMSEVLKIDGSYGEGGGQILRTALSLSLVLNRPIEIYNIRKARPKPGLQPQHLTCVNSCQKISSAKVDGNELQSTKLFFSPNQVNGGEFIFDVSEKKGSAGSVSLIFQTLLLPLSFAKSKSTIELIGGTHVPWSPSFNFLKDIFVPAVRRMGIRAKLELEKCGFYPKGGGRIRAQIEPLKELAPITITARGALKKINATSAVANLPRSIAERQWAKASEYLKGKNLDCEVIIEEATSLGAGTFFFITAEFENIKAGFGSLGAIGKRAEKVGEEATKDFLEYLSIDAAVEPHLSDQLVLYMALAKGKSRYTASKITRHLLTNIWVINQFLPNIEIKVGGEEGKPGEITVNKNIFKR